MDELDKIITFGLGGIEIGSGVVVEKLDSTITGGVDALRTPLSCIVGLVDSLVIAICDLNLGACKLSSKFDDTFFVPWLIDSPMGNSTVLERESLSSSSNSMALREWVFFSIPIKLSTFKLPAISS
jgi:hypothetical protein